MRREPSSSLPGPGVPHDPTRMPDGVPPGNNWDGVRLVRNKTGSKRHPDTPAELWPRMSAAQRRHDIERFEEVQRQAEERRRRERERAATAMPLAYGVKPEHRKRLKILYWDKLGHITTQQLALVARLVSQAEVDRTPDPKSAMDKDWKKLTDNDGWLADKVRQFPDVQGEAQHQQRKIHIGRIFEIYSQKGTELPKGHPDQKWKGRSVFQGNQVSAENDDHAIFAELGSSPASMEAAKIIDFFGSQLGFSKQQADARQAYTQASGSLHRR